MKKDELEQMYCKETNKSFVKWNYSEDYVKWLEDKYIKLINDVEEVDKDEKHFLFLMIY